MALRQSAFARLSINAAAVLSVMLIVCLGAPVAEGHGSQRQPLSLSQLKTLIELKTPDSAIAGEIRDRGLEFVPSRDTLETLRRLGAGPQTLQALDDLRPMLDEAKQVIPEVLTQIYQALDQGNLQAARPLLDQRLASDSQKLDAICKPFTYRAHYIEAIIERPQRRFEVRVRILFQPLDEHAYVLFFAGAQGHFILQDVTDPPEDWFRAEFSSAIELSRRFVFAAKAGKTDALSSLVTADMPITSFVNNPCWKQFFQDVGEPTASARLNSYKGLKIEVKMDLNLAGLLGFNAPEVGGSYFFVERVGEDERIVVADPRGTAQLFYMPRHVCPDVAVLVKIEDPNLESRTLERFRHRAQAGSFVQSSPTPDPATAKAREVLNEMVAGQFGKIEAQYDAAMSAALPPGKLGEFWHQLVGQNGGFKSVISERSQAIQKYQVVILVCAFERATFDARFAFNSDGTIGGIHFLPHKEVTP